jgi:hypothetical protein
MGVGQLAPGQTVTVSFDWKGSAAVGGIIRISIISVPGGSGPSQSQTILDTGAFPADWTSVGPTAVTLGSEVGGGVTFQVFIECGAESSCVSNVSLDNISIVAALADGGGEPDTVLVTFDESTPPSLSPFGGATTVIATGPAGGDDSNTLVIDRNGGQNFAGTTVIVPEVSGAPGTQTLSAQVFSPTAGVPMPAILAINSSVGTGVVQANETVVAGWQTLTWTFTNLDTSAVYVRFALLPNNGTIDAEIYYFDNITLVGSGGGGGGGGGSGLIGDAPGSCGGPGELAMNCDFETGDLFGWEAFPNGGITEVVETGGSTSVYAAHIVAGPNQNALIKQFELEQGIVTPGDAYTISFDMKGTIAGDGGVVFGEFISEGAEGQSTNEFLNGGPIFPTINWATYTFTPTAGADVSRGITFQLVAVCGAVSSCGVDVYFDNVSIVRN